MTVVRLLEHQVGTVWFCCPERRLGDAHGASRCAVSLFLIVVAMAAGGCASSGATSSRDAGGFPPASSAGLTGPSIQVDTKGVEFKPWVRRFFATIRRHWTVPSEALRTNGQVVVTFRVHKDGSIIDIVIAEPAVVESFNESARCAVQAANVSQPLPAAYPQEYAVFTLTFYYRSAPR